ncbi:hypothetical protein CBLAS_0289 [Campylobacter blaseri]|uniref:TNase-like domain-containing protein n=1 Tax=Campylobacter blaseri TaxID=2042961 RepID=A0A2P8R1B8_9BACT|nr:thermonuclease family protein [Campylobacter blaseri]PSM52290.1 hypothetical protein CQ405_04350 [Campylobacter blaseri]PSM54056.1 hypothetical protein CRN67_04350 [Campylobacter blaseri]QKF85497.1 hypothetical protein CBLAS_0289 [Campylobacter blaseri]
MRNKYLFNLIYFLTILLLFLIIDIFHIGNTLIVNYVADGDTIHFNKGVKCRLMYIDAPENFENKKFLRDYSQCQNTTKKELLNAGKNSTYFLRSIIKKGDQLTVKIIDTDQFNRQVCIIFKNNENINNIMIEEGYAVPYQKFIHTKDRAFYNELVNNSKNNKKGNWDKYYDFMNCLLNIRN